MSAADLQLAPAGPEDEGKRCGVCQTRIAPPETIGRCPSCEAPHHPDCWIENGGCSTYGCDLMQTAAKEPPAFPQSHWGVEEKRCPRCSNRVKLAALRCRFCGALFEESQPGAADARPRRKGAAVAILIGGMLPPTAPVALVAGGLWALTRGKEVRPRGLEQVMIRVGLIAAGTTTLLLAAVLLLRSIAP